MIRVVVISHTYIVAANRGKLRHLADRPDVDMTLICPDAWPEPDFGIRKFEPEEGIRSVVIPVSKAGDVRRYNFPTLRLAKTIVNIRPDLIQVESEAASVTAMQAAVCKSLSPFRLLLFAWDNLPGGTIAHRAFEWVCFRRIDHLIAGSDQARQIARNNGYVGPSTVIPQLGVSPESYRKAPTRDMWKEREGFRVGYVGRLDRRKGVASLLDAVTTVPGTLLTLVGDGSMRTELERKAGVLGIADRVGFTGGVPHVEVASWINGLDLLVLPSISTPGWTEQFGHVLVEAMAASVPVIGSRSGVIPQIIGETGLLFDEGDAAGIADCIRRLMDQPGLAAGLAQKGAALIQDHYTDQRIAEKTFAVWSEVLAAR